MPPTTNQEEERTPIAATRTAPPSPPSPTTTTTTTTPAPATAASAAAPAVAVAVDPLLARTRQELDELCAGADRAIRAAWVRNRCVWPVVWASPIRRAQRALWRAGREIFADEVHAEMVRFRERLWLIRAGMVLEHGVERTDEVWGTLRAGECLPANYRKFRDGDTYRLCDVLAAFGSILIEGVEDESVEGEVVEDAEDAEDEDGLEIDWDGDTKVGSDLGDAEADWDAVTEVGSEREW